MRIGLIVGLFLIAAAPCAANAADCRAGIETPDPAYATVPATALYRDALKSVQSADYQKADAQLTAAFITLNQVADAKKPEFEQAALARLIETALARKDLYAAYFRLIRMRHITKGGQLPAAWIQDVMLHADKETANEPEEPDVVKALAFGQCRSIGVEPSLDLRIVFDFDKSDITPEGESQVAAFAANIRGLTQRVKVRGHTDGAGSAGYNLALSVRRARAVAERLHAQNPDLVIEIEGVGAKELLYPNAKKDDAGAELNRRVEFVFGP